MNREVVHLVDLLPEAKLDAAAADHLQLQFIEVGGEQRQAIFQHPDSTLQLELPSAPGGGVLRFGCGIKTVSWERLDAPVRFRVGIVEGRRLRRRGQVCWLWELALDPRREAGHRRWVDARIELPKARTLVLQTASELTAGAWAGWSDPQLELRTAPAPVVRRARPPQHLLLFSADALRADFVEDPGVRTPHLDALAADGVRFDHARSASVTTPGSYATLLTGRTPGGHGVLHEWGVLPPALPNLASELRSAGWGTVFAPSHHDWAAPDQGFPRSFDEVLPCLGNPSQDAAVTARGLLRRLALEADSPLFVWAPFFDTHPARQMPADALRDYYTGDPRDPSREWEAQNVGAVRGVESLKMLSEALDGLRGGRIDARLACRLRDTGLALSGERPAGPDLASHLAALGPDAQRGLPRSEFAAWLVRAGDELERGRVDPQLEGWLEELLPRLAEIEREVIGWLDGVVDYHYALAQVRAAATHVDRQVGRVIEFMRDANLYDSATIVFLSPHGEFFGEGGHHFEHHTPLEASLRIPVIVKPAASTGIPPGRVGGVFDATDLMPTLLELAGLESPSVDGSSRVPEMRVSGTIGAHESVAWGVDGLQLCLARPPAKLIRTYGWLPQPDGSWTAPGSSDWRDLDDDEPCPPPPDAAELERRLEELRA